MPLKPEKTDTPIEGLPKPAICSRLKNKKTGTRPQSLSDTWFSLGVPSGVREAGQGRLLLPPPPQAEGLLCVEFVSAFAKCSTQNVARMEGLPQSDWLSTTFSSLCEMGRSCFSPKRPSICGKFQNDRGGRPDWPRRPGNQGGAQGRAALGFAKTGIFWTLVPSSRERLRPPKREHFSYFEWTNSCTTFKPCFRLLFASIYVGESNQKPGFLGCETDFVHP